MIQRIQTVYLLLAVVFSVCCLSLSIGTFTTGEGMDTSVFREYNLCIARAEGSHDFSVWPMFAILLMSAASGLYSIFMYNNRIAQARFCVFNTLLIAGWYIVYFVFSRIYIGTEESSSLFKDFSFEIPAVFPMISAVMYLLARKAVMADEKLIKAADRIR